jgi:murein DD-endopeptidase MepM/ murein hydrolase activator NlpD
MTNPCPGHTISTPYGKQGSAWGCGWHDGADYAAPAGADVVAAWGGIVVEAAYPTSFGSAFGRAVIIDHDPLPDGSPGLWGLYAHLSAENVSPGQRVEVGQKIGDVGTTGNSSGNHLHFGIYAQPSWCSGCGIDPAPWISASGAAGTPPPAGTPTVYLSKLHYGQTDSDSVKHLQAVLNGHPLQGGQDLPISGNYLDQTDEEVRLCQVQHGYGNDPVNASWVGPEQAEHLFAGKGYTVIADG